MKKDEKPIDEQPIDATDVQEEVLEEKKIPSKRESFIGSLKERMGADADGIDWEDEDSRYGAYASHLERQDGELSQFKDSDKRLRDAVTKDSRFADVLADVAAGEDVTLSLIRNYGKDLTEAMGDESRADEYTKANEDYQAKLQRMEEITGMDKIREENLAENSDTLEEFFKEKEMDEDQAQSFFDEVFDLTSKVYAGELTRDVMDKLYNLLNYDSHIEKAREEGLVNGRNEQLESAKNKRIGDGLPTLNNGGAVSDDPKPRRPKTTSMWG